MPRMGDMIRAALIAAAIALLTASPAAAAKTCHLTIKQQRHSGSTYLISLTVKNVSCSTGLKVEKDWQACRHKTPGHKTCKRSVDGYRSKQTLLDSSPTQYDAKVTATRGSRVVKFVYTQN